MRNPRRAAFTLVLALAVLFTLIWMQGCATEYQWVKVAPASEHVLWRKVSRTELYRICSLTPERAPNLGGCAFMGRICEVYSDRSQEEAARTPSADGDDLATHELKHCAGYVHNQNRRWN